MAKLNSMDVTDKELEELIAMYKALPEVPRSLLVSGANLLFASEKAREKTRHEMLKKEAV